MLAAVRIILASLLAVLIAIPAQAQAFLPVDRDKVLNLFSPDNFEEIPLPKEKAPADAEQLRTGGDIVSVFYSKSAQTRIAMAGRDGHIHSVRIMVAVVNNSQQKNMEIFSALSSLFSMIYPDWPDAKDWPEQSLDASWSATAREMNPDTRRGIAPGAPDDLIPSKEIGGVVASTFGVPPDLVIYAVTAREACVPRRIAGNRPQGDPIQRLVC